MSTKPRESAPLIAVIGCDGSGKSTISAHVLEYVGRYGPAAYAHLGKQAGNVGRAVARWPLVGRTLDRAITRQSDAAHAQLTRKKQPGVLAALVIAAFTIRRRRRFRHMLALRRRHFIVVTDRFPQLAVPGAYDGPQLTIQTGGNPIVNWLARFEHKSFVRMTSHRPDLVLRLNVDLDTACARKPDHRRELLARKVAVTDKLSFNGAPIADIDATRPLADVLRDVTRAVAKLMYARGYTLPPAARD